MVLVEAFALGTPAIASGIGSLEEIIREGCSGLKFRPGDADDLARVVSQLVRKQKIRRWVCAEARARFSSSSIPQAKILTN